MEAAINPLDELKGLRLQQLAMQPRLLALLRWIRSTLVQWVPTSAF